MSQPGELRKAIFPFASNLPKALPAHLLALRVSKAHWCKAGFDKRSSDYFTAPNEEPAQPLRGPKRDALAFESV